MTRLLPALMLLSGCSIGGGPEVSATRALEPFSKVSVQDGLTVHFSPGAVNEVDITTQQRVLENLQTTVRDGTLTVRIAPGVRITSLEWTTVTVTGVEVDELSASGGSTLLATKLQADALTLTASGGAHLESTGSVSSLTLSASGGAHLESTGSVSSLTLSASGGATVKATAQQAHLEVSGGAQVDLTADVISGTASGGATITTNAGADVTGLVLTGGATVTRN